MSIYRFSKGGRLFVQGTREDEPRENVVSAASTAATPANDDLRAIYTKRRLSTEVLGRKRRLLRQTNILSLSHPLPLFDRDLREAVAWKSRHDHELRWCQAVGMWPSSGIVDRDAISNRSVIDRSIEGRERKGREGSYDEAIVGRGFGTRPPTHRTDVLKDRRSSQRRRRGAARTGPSVS